MPRRSNWSNKVYFSRAFHSFSGCCEFPTPESRVFKFYEKREFLNCYFAICDVIVIRSLNELRLRRGPVEHRENLCPSVRPSVHPGFTLLWSKARQWLAKAGAIFSRTDEQMDGSGRRTFLQIPAVFYRFFLPTKATTKKSLSRSRVPMTISCLRATGSLLGTFGFCIASCFSFICVYVGLF